MPTTLLRRGALILPLLVVLAACSTTGGGGASQSPVTSSPPSEPAPTASPSEAPSEPAATPTSAPTESPIEVVRFDPQAILRATADDVAVRVQPDLDAELVAGYDQDAGTAVDSLTLMTGDEVGVVWGPIFSDGHTWYAVQHHDVRSITFDSGWVAADFFEQVGTSPTNAVLVAIDGLGAGDAGVGQARAGAGLYVNVAVTPMPGEESCEAEVILIGTDGEATTLAGGEITETMTLFSSPLENRATVQEEAGEFTLQVETDCSWAGMAFEPQA